VSSYLSFREVIPKKLRKTLENGVIMAEAFGAGAL
jgi:hypothetical protein